VAEMVWADEQTGLRFFECQNAKTQHLGLSDPEKLRGNPARLGLLTELAMRETTGGQNWAAIEGGGASYGGLRRSFQFHRPTSESEKKI
jgi:hypothetical protein